MKLFSGYASVDFSHVKNQFIAVICGKRFNAQQWFITCTTLMNSSYLSEYVRYFIRYTDRLVVAFPAHFVVSKYPDNDWSNNNTTSIMAGFHLISWWIFRYICVSDCHKATRQKSGLLRSGDSVLCIQITAMHASQHTLLNSSYSQRYSGWPFC